MSYYRQQLEDYLKTLDIKADVVMDVGGAALPVKDRVGFWNVKDYIIVDNYFEKNEPKFVKPDFKVDLNKWDCCGMHYKRLRNWRISGDPKSNIPQRGQGADIIFCLEVMEYIWELKGAFRFLSEMFKKGYASDQRILYITFPFVYPLHNPASEDCLRFTYNGAVRLLDEHGFKILEIHKRVDRTGKLAEFYQADGMHVAGEGNITGYIVKAKKK